LLALGHIRSLTRNIIPEAKAKAVIHIQLLMTMKQEMSKLVSRGDILPNCDHLGFIPIQEARHIVLLRPMASARQLL